MRTVVALLTLVAALVVPAAAPAGDDFDDATQLRIGELKMEDISTYQHIQGEPMTPLDPDNFYCPKTGGQVRALKTGWFQVPPTGRNLTATIGGFDALIATRYEGDDTISIGDPLLCNWKVLQTPVDTFTLNWQATLAKTHFLQIGRCQVTDGNGDECNVGTVGTVEVVVNSAPPGNDDRAGATNVVTGQQRFDNHGTDTETNEDVTCDSAPIRSTVWFKAQAPSDGTAIVTATPTPGDPLDLAMQAYRGSETAPLDCGDPVGTTPARLTLDVTGGTEYYVQVASSTTDAFTHPQGTFEFDVAFVPTPPPPPNPDRDGDGDNNDTDCAPDDPSRHRGATDIYANGVDENCDGVDHLDFDGDGFRRFPPGDDCDDRDHTTHPHAGEILGDRIDQNCNGAKEPRDLPALNIDLKANRHSRGKLIFGRVRVSPVRNGYLIRITCSGGRRKGCPRRGVTRSIKKGTSFQSNHTYAKVLRNGAFFQVTVTQPGANSIGVTKRFMVRKGRLRQRTCEMVPTDDAGRAFTRRC